MQHVITADGGLNLRTGPGTNFPSKGIFKSGTSVNVLARTGDWAQVDVNGNGVSDGFMSAAHLRAVAPPTPAPPPKPPVVAPAASATSAAAALPGALAGISAAKVKQMFPATPLPAIQANLPFVLAGLA